MTQRILHRAFATCTLAILVAIAPASASKTSREAKTRKPQSHSVKIAAKSRSQGFVEILVQIVTDTGIRIDPNGGLW